ncbi:MAG: hypothetical protein ACWA6U_18500 [Breznakibacter sp.]
MMDIDFNKTLHFKRMTYKISWIDLLSGLFVNAIISLWFPIIGFFLLYDAINGFGNNPSMVQRIFEIFLFIIFLFLGIIIIRTFVKINRLKKIEGISIEINRETVRRIIDDKNWGVQNENKKFLNALIPSAFSSGRQLYILFENEWIYINSTTFGLHDLKSPFHFIADKKAVDLLRDEFKKEIESTPHNTPYTA